MQYASLVSDVSSGWTGSPSATPICANLADTDDATLIQSPSAPVNAISEHRFAAVSQPFEFLLGGIECRMRKNSGGGQQINLTMDLLHDSTPLASWPHVNLIADWFEVAYPLTPVELGTVTNWTDLRVRFTANKVGSGAGRRAQVSRVRLILLDPDLAISATIGGVAWGAAGMMSSFASVVDSVRAEVLQRTEPLTAEVRNINGELLWKIEVQ